MFKKKVSDKPSVFSRAWDKVCDFFYNIKVKIYSKLGKKESSNKKSKFKATVFYWLVLALPLLQFIIFYVVVNANSFALAFKTYTFDSEAMKYESSFAGFSNFRDFITDIFSPTSNLGRMMLNSLIICLSSIFVGIFLSLVFSYFIYKKMRGSKVFRVFLFLPSIISVIVLVTVFTFFIDFAFPSILAKFGIAIESPLSHSSTYFATIVFYNLWVGFGTTTLMFSGAMSRIPESVIEAGKIDGVTPLKEFFCLVLPLIGPTVATFLVTGVAGLFINQANIYAFSGTGAGEKVQTIGYFLFIQVMGNSSTLIDYPYASAAGLTMSVVAIPLTLLVKKILDKFVPAVEY